MEVTGAECNGAKLKLAQSLSLSEALGLFWAGPREGEGGPYGQGTN